MILALALKLMSAFAPAPPASPVQRDALENLKKNVDSMSVGADDNNSNVEDNSNEEEEVEDSDDGELQTDYGKSQYWDDRYSRYSPFDWLMEYPHFKEHGLNSFIQPTDNILMIGCGSAQFSADMYDDGYCKIKNIDLSSVAIEQMSAASKDRTGMTWEVMNASNLTYDDEVFEVAFDKSTMDCIFCCDNSNHQISEMMMESWRVLKPGGIFISLSLHSTEKVLPFITMNENGEPFSWSDVEYFSVPNPRWEPNTAKSENYICVVAIKPAFVDAKVRKQRGVKITPATLPTFGTGVVATDNVTAKE